MTALIKMTKQAIADRKGVTAMEYGVIAAAIVVVCIAGFQLIGTNLNTVVNSAATALVKAP